MADALTEQLDSNARAPKRAKGDSGEVEQHSLPEQIEYLKFRAAQCAVKKKGFPVRMSKLVPPGTA